MPNERASNILLQTSKSLSDMGVMIGQLSERRTKMQEEQQGLASKMLFDIVDRGMKIESSAARKGYFKHFNEKLVGLADMIPGGKGMDFSIFGDPLGEEVFNSFLKSMNAGEFDDSTKQLLQVAWPADRTGKSMSEFTGYFQDIAGRKAIAEASGSTVPDVAGAAFAKKELGQDVSVTPSGIQVGSKGMAAGPGHQSVISQYFERLNKYRLEKRQQLTKTGQKRLSPEQDEMLRIQVLEQLANDTGTPVEELAQIIASGAGGSGGGMSSGVSLGGGGTPPAPRATPAGSVPSVTRRVETETPVGDELMDLGTPVYKDISEADKSAISSLSTSTEYASEVYSRYLNVLKENPQYIGAFGGTLSSLKSQEGVAGSVSRMLLGELPPEIEEVVKGTENLVQAVVSTEEAGRPSDADRVWQKGLQLSVKKKESSLGTMAATLQYTLAKVRGKKASLRADGAPPAAIEELDKIEQRTGSMLDGVRAFAQTYLQENGNDEYVRVFTAPEEVVRTTSRILYGPLIKLSKTLPKGQHLLMNMTMKKWKEEIVPKLPAEYQPAAMSVTMGNSLGKLLQELAKMESASGE